MGAEEAAEDGGAARQLAWAEVETATRGFSSRVIGYGGFSTVYLAALPSSRLGAVKVHCSSERLHRAFHRELDVLLSIRHRYIVRLLGYCDERDEGVLVFQYAPNGDLHQWLHCGGGGDALPWARRVAVAFQVAAALEYLHESRQPAVIHGDIKASNVLLDADLDAKLCDFGFAHVGVSATAGGGGGSRSSARRHGLAGVRRSAPPPLRGGHQEERRVQLRRAAARAPHREGGRLPRDRAPAHGGGGTQARRWQGVRRGGQEAGRRLRRR